MNDKTEQTTEREDSAQIITVPASEITPLAMLDRALSSGATPDVLERLMSLQERWEANQSRRAFDEAIAVAKSEIPVIKKNRASHNSRYADFAALAAVVDPIITKYGLSYRFRATQDERIHVTCVLTHEAGHAEENTLSGPADGSGSKNAIQAIGSTLTYLQRYTLTQALGLAVADDDDGNAAGAGEPVDSDQLDALLDRIAGAGADIELFCKHYNIDAAKNLPAKRFDDAMKALNKKAKANA